MHELYAQLSRPTGAPLRTFEEAFEPSNSSIMWEWRQGQLKGWPTRALFNGRPTDDGSFYKGLQTAIESVIEVLLGLSMEAGAPAEVTTILEKLAALAKQPVTLGAKHPLVAVIRRMRPRIWANLEALDALVSETPEQTEKRHELLTLDFSTTLVFGALRDNVGVEGFDILDDENWYDWLQRHGVHPATLRSPLPMLTVNICYQSPKGDTSRLAQMAAGSYLNWSLRSYAYMDSFLWGFIAGTGEAIIVPLYQVLHRRGVKFEFFQKVQAVQLDATKTFVEEIKVIEQATLKVNGTAYNPLIQVQTKGYDLPLPSWPKEPDYAQLNEGDELKAEGVDLESYWNGWTRLGSDGAPEPMRVLKVGVEFDHVVFAISLGAVPFLCGDLIEAKPEWKAMVDHIPTLQTQAMQLWLSRTPAELGWKWPLHRIENDVAFT